MDKIKRNSLKTWYVVNTRSRAEKKVRDELIHKNIECFLPVQKKLRQWKDRKKWVEMPLISGYCFVHISDNEYNKVLHTDNVVCYIRFEGKAAVIPDNQIGYLKQMLAQNDFEVEVTHDNEGPLIGIKGELVDVRGKNKFILRIHQINNTFTAEVPASSLSLLPKELEI